jgi:hypothetical protein
LSSTLDLSGLDRIATKMATLTNINAAPLMRTWEKVVETDNRTGILAGLDKDGVPMTPVRYRPKPNTGFRVNKPGNVARAGRGASHFTKGIVAQYNAEHKRTLARFRLNQRAAMRRGQYSGITGIGPSLVERNNNLTTKEYRILGGPPLAPRDQFSRVITNFKTTYTGPPYGIPNWQVIGAWEEVVSTKGVSFLRYHFEGIGQAKRDLRGVRPSGMTKATEALGNWARLYVREHFGK